MNRRHVLSLLFALSLTACGGVATPPPSVAPKPSPAPEQAAPVGFARPQLIEFYADW